VGGQPLDLRAPGHDPLDLRTNELAVEERNAGRSPAALPNLTGPNDPDLSGGPAVRHGTPDGELVRSIRRPAADNPDALLHPLRAIGETDDQLAPGQPIPQQAAPGGSRSTLQIAPGELVTTFVTGDDTQVDRYLVKAEGLLKSGEYYRAADQYNLARALDSRNPLPLLGRAMALLAAGDYMSSSASLFHAIREFETTALYQVDLTAFVPDLAVLDRRRADLEERLSEREIFRLRFLLGFAEYSSNLKALGLENMEKAAAQAPEELAHLRRFVATLKAQNPATARPLPVNPE
jgi:hypothetical protein